MFEELRQLLQTQPFHPFRVRMNDGRHYDIRHPEFMGISRSTVTIAVPPEPGGADHMVICQVRNIASLEHLSEPTARS